MTGEKVWKDIVECKERNDGSCKLYNERPPAKWVPPIIGIVILIMIFVSIYSITHPS